VTEVRNFLRNKPIPETSEGVWLRIKEAVLPSAEKNLRPLRIPHNEKSYISDRIRKWISARKELFESIVEKGQVVDEGLASSWRKSVSRSLHEDYLAKIGADVDKLEKAFEKGMPPWAAYQIEEAISGKSKKSSTNISTDASGNIFSKEEDRSEFWRQEFTIRFAAAAPMGPQIQPILIPAVPSIQRLRIDVINAVNQPGDHNQPAGIERAPAIAGPGL
jgi:hypothetical protein